MIRAEIVIHKTRTLLQEFLTPMQAQVDKPRKRFPTQVIRGILFLGTLVVMELCRWVRDDCSDRFHQDKRLLHHLISPRGGLTQAVTAYRRSMARWMAADTPLILDLTNLAKPRAKKMKYLNLVRDGSEGTLVKGYGCIEVYLCSSCGSDITSRILFNGLIFDPEYFRQKMAESRQRKQKERERVRQMLTEGRSGDLVPDRANPGCVPGLVGALNALTQVWMRMSP